MGVGRKWRAPGAPPSSLLQKKKIIIINNDFSFLLFKKMVGVSLAGMAFPSLLSRFLYLLSPPQTDPGSDCLLLYGFLFWS
jgi:hypothetical protein